MTRWMKRSALVGALSMLALLGAGCRDEGRGGAGEAGSPADLEYERRPSELQPQPQPDATGGAGGEESVTGGEEEEGESGLNVGGATGGDIGSTDEELEDRPVQEQQSGE